MLPSSDPRLKLVPGPTINKNSNFLVLILDKENYEWDEDLGTIPNQVMLPWIYYIYLGLVV